MHSALKLFASLIVTYPESAEAGDTKKKINKMMTSRKLFKKAYDLQYKVEDFKGALSLYEALLFIFPDVSQIKQEA